MLRIVPYRWEQSLRDVDIYIDVPKGTRAKSLSVKIEPNKLQVSLPNQPLLIDVICTKYQQFYRGYCIRT